MVDADGIIPVEGLPKAHLAQPTLLHIPVWSDVRLSAASSSCEISI